MRHESLLAILVEIAQVLAAELHVLAEVVVAPMGDSLELADPERKGIFDIGRRRRIECQLIAVVVAQSEPVGLETRGRRTTGILPCASRRTTPWPLRAGRKTRSPSARIHASER